MPIDRRSENTRHQAEHHAVHGGLQRGSERETEETSGAGEGEGGGAEEGGEEKPGAPQETVHHDREDGRVSNAAPGSGGPSRHTFVN